MDRKQAERLGAFLRQAREEKGMTLQELAEPTGMNNATISRLESGAFAVPGADKLARIAEVLGLSLADVYAFADYSVPSELPAFEPYLRTKYQQLPDEAVEQIERYAQKMAKKHGVTLDGPVDGQDENP